MFVYNGTVVRVIDGDTIILKLDLGFNINYEVTVRLAHVNTNEVHGVKHSSEEYAKGIVQFNFVKNLLPEGKDVSFRSYDFNGKYGRAIGDIEIQDVGFLSELLLEEFPNICSDKD